MKSGREKTLALRSLQYGHHAAPQYKNTGFFSVPALAKAASRPPANHAIPDPGWATAAGAATGACGPFGISRFWQPATSRLTTHTAVKTFATLMPRYR